MIKKDVVADIISFIRAISKAGAAERIQLFKTMYLDGDYEDICYSSDAGFAVPSSFDKLCQLDNSLLKSSGMKTAALYTAFIVELGKYYLHSRFDKADIDQQKYLDYIKILQMHQKASQNVANNKQKHDKALFAGPCIKKRDCIRSFGCSLLLVVFCFSDGIRMGLVHRCCGIYDRSSTIVKKAFSG